MKFRALVLQLHPPQNFCRIHTLTHGQTFSRISQTCKSIKNRKSKICTKLILSSIYIEENNKRIIQLTLLCYPKAELDQTLLLTIEFGRGYPQQCFWTRLRWINNLCLGWVEMIKMPDMSWKYLFSTCNSNSTDN